MPIMITAPVPPRGPDFTMETMRAIAQRHGAISFTEHIQTDASDVGYLVNPADTPNQFGVSTYQTAAGFIVTHSISDYVPEKMRKMYTRYATQSTPTSAQLAPMVPAYVEVLDITVPYQLPHVIVLPRLYMGFARFMQPKNPLWNKKEATPVELEGDFSEFVAAFTPKGEEIDAFVYLAPNLMELVLRRGTNFIIEFTGNHVYVYYRQSDMGKVDTSAGHNTYITAELHEQILETGLAIADSLARAARPASEPTHTTPMMPKPSAAKAMTLAAWPLYYFIFMLMAGIPLFIMISALLSPFDLAYVGMVMGFVLVPTSPLVPIIVYTSRYMREKRRWQRYQERYSSIAA